MHVLRWILLIPALAATFYLTVTATIATHYLIEQHACPAVDFDRGICNNRALGMTLRQSSMVGRH